MQLIGMGRREGHYYSISYANFGGMEENWRSIFGKESGEKKIEE